MSIAVHIQAAGLMMLLLAGIHVVFPRYFNWREELPRLSLINQDIMKVHTLFVAVTVGLMGLLATTTAGALSSTVLGQRVCLGFAVFWALRLLVQFFGYSAANWRGKRFETAVHLAMSILWSYFVGVFGWAAFGGYL